MSAIRKSAQGQECQVRIPGVCNGNPETTVWCHVNDGTNGVGAKPNDMSGCYGCSDCHDAIDRRRRDVPQTDLCRYILDAVLRSQRILRDLGIIEVRP